MNKNAGFTICAKNYLAHAISLKESFLKHNPNSDFFIFLSDLPYGLETVESELILLEETWIPDWKKMAFKYNVIEFSTSIKPFCFKKLFNQKYTKVIYLDPDIYVTKSLNEIYEYLNGKSIVLTPHYCNIQTNYTGSITEEEILFVGIYNLGFTAIRNNIIGNKIVDWWTNRLSNKCYADKFDALHVDQKWMDFIPAFFPNDTLITHHMGINPAIWNLHERELIIENDEYFIRDNQSKVIFPLLFFHFSGFDPYNPKLINRRHPKYNTDIYKSYIPLFKEYVECLYKNHYEKYSKMIYSFNSFSNGENIVALHRRLYRVNIGEYPDIDPFKESSKIYSTYKKNNLLSGVKSNQFSIFTEADRNRKESYEKMLKFLFKVLKRLIGIKYYLALIKFIHDLTRYEQQAFLIKKD